MEELFKSVAVERDLRQLSDTEMATLLDSALAGADLTSPLRPMLATLAERLRRASNGSIEHVKQLSN